MASKVIYVHNISRNDIASAWETKNSVLSKGEIGVDNTNKIFKIGDGITGWNSIQTQFTGTLIASGDDVRNLKGAPGSFGLIISDSVESGMAGVLGYYGTTGVFTPIATNTDVVKIWTKFEDLDKKIAALPQAIPNSFGSITNGKSTVSSTAPSDTLTIDVGLGMSIVFDESTKKITFSQNVITQADTTSSKTASGGSFTAIDSVSVDRSGHITGVNTATISVPTQYELPVASSTVLGGVKSGTDITVDASGNVSVKDNSHAHTVANVTGLQDALDTKQGNLSTVGDKSGFADADGMVITDSANANVAKKISFSILKATLKTYFDTIYTKYILPVATSTTLGGVKSGTDITVDASGNVSVNDNSHAHTVANVTGLQTTLDDKVDKSQIVTGTVNGSISVAGTNVPVKGLGSAAYTNTDAYDPAGAANTAKEQAIAAVNALKGDAADASTDMTLYGVKAYAKSYADTVVTAADAMVIKGSIGVAGVGTITALPTTHKVGWTYKVASVGTYAGQKCEVGDMIICLVDGTVANDAHWMVIQNNIDGAVTSSVTASVDGDLAVFSGTTGNVLKTGVNASHILLDTDTFILDGGNA